MPLNLSLSTREIGKNLVIEMSGGLTVAQQTLLREYVLRFLEAGKRHFVLKMEAMSQLDSSGLGQLVTVYTSVTNRGGSVRLLAPSPRVCELLQITKLDTVFEIIEDEARIRDIQ